MKLFSKIHNDIWNANKIAGIKINKKKIRYTLYYGGKRSENANIGHLKAICCEKTAELIFDLGGSEKRIFKYTYLL